MKKSSTRAICFLMALCLCLSAAGCASGKSGAQSETAATDAQSGDGVTVYGKLRLGHSSRIRMSEYDKKDEMYRNWYDEAKASIEEYADIHYFRSDKSADEAGIDYENNLIKFNEDGKGFAVYSPMESHGMNQRAYIFARTKDSGETWEMLPYSTYTSYYITDVRLIGDKLFVIWNNAVSWDSFLTYSEDYLDSYLEVCYHPIDPIEDADVGDSFCCNSGFIDGFEEMDYDARLISVNGEDSSIIIGLYKSFSLNPLLQDNCLALFRVKLGEQIRSTEFQMIYKDDDTLGKIEHDD